jgi:hypothetical protein
VVQKFARCLPNSILQSSESKSLRTQQALYLFARTTCLISLILDPSSRKRSIGHIFLISQMSLETQQRSLIRCYCLYQGGNQSIHIKLYRAYHQATFCLRAVVKWAARFGGGQETVEDDSSPGRPPKAGRLIKMTFREIRSK